MATYTVEAGDSLSSIALRLWGSYANWPTLAAANGITAPYVIQPGQVLQVPSAKSSAPLSTSLVPVAVRPAVDLTTTKAPSSSGLSSFLNIKTVLIGAVLVAGIYLLIAQTGEKRPKKRRARPAAEED